MMGLHTAYLHSTHITYINESEVCRYSSSELEQDDAQAQHAEGGEHDEGRRRHRGDRPLSGGGEALEWGERKVEAEDGDEEDRGTGGEEDDDEEAVGGDRAAAGTCRWHGQMVVVEAACDHEVSGPERHMERQGDERCGSESQVRHGDRSTHDGTRWLS